MYFSATNPTGTLFVPLYGLTSGQAIRNGIQTVDLGLPRGVLVAGVPRVVRCILGVASGNGLLGRA